ncbi:Hydantoinase B/oxoprolinase-domain-containing protein [Fimicolochytrium jonesii]|uniref:Hydantoinase B/oxoprolinase-domain-containing protein n=1 Tax=Fimicolochytrium jonesii TaxID=1396493 RepID=UPI0022FDBC0D|nr:Hydantoinase B/oxoprolinase-domain-containing protein [Fimicolochytrium jonesii]KAI8816179.1 Hydantoinase B/oxoprolinase-domain-containing protein [Fimicolochytrium jonesii]
MSLTKGERNITICIDRGGTFTDCIAFVPTKDGTSPYKTIVVKLLSVDPQNYPDAPREGIRRILELATGVPHPADKLVNTSRLKVIRMGTTVATNALLERKGDASALVITKGFKDLLHIGNQSRPKIFDLAIEKPAVLYKTVIEVHERVALVKEGEDEGGEHVTGVTGEKVEILEPLNIGQVEKDLRAVYDSGIRSIAISLLHSYTFPDHEKRVAAIAKQIGFTNITLSSAIMPMVKIVPRAASAMADAYLTPVIQRYIEGFFSGFDEDIRDPKKVRVEFMQSDGGLTPVEDFSGFRAILSGPAGGVVGYARTSWDEPEANSVRGGKAIIGFDQGGTSTDVSRYAGQYEHVFETTTADVTIQAPQLNISTVAAGGGSQLFFRSGLFVVGPESAGANPGPACYRKGGPATITDANLVLGRLVPAHFPAVFGPSQSEPLSTEAAFKVLQEIADEVNRASPGGQPMSVDEVAFGFIKVANEAMARPIRGLTQAKGFNTADHILACFGGAGGQHACAIARSLGIGMILIHKHSSILSAYGLSLADVVHEEQEPSAHTLGEDALPTIRDRVQHLQTACTTYLQNEGFDHTAIELEVYLNLRYQGTDHAMMTQKPEDSWDFQTPFVAQYQQEFGFTLPDRDIIIDDIRVRGIGKSAVAPETDHSVYADLATLTQRDVSGTHIDQQQVFWEGGRVDTPVYLIPNMQPGDHVHGPALLIDRNSTVALEPLCHGTMTTSHLVITLDTVKPTTATASTDLDPIKLSVFAHRFMSIAEQMGTTLRKTAISTNIKERLDFSCALFGPDGGLIANAPHIPIHLGSMQEAVRWQMRSTEMEDGDVLVTNHPSAGGSHLPDITVITPVFNKGVIEFFVASRGHHADIGGIRAGSMPPDSRELYQEGAAIKSFKLVRKGHFDEPGIRRILVDEPAQYPGCSGSRCINDCISDLKAQTAANHRGITLVRQLIEEYGLETVQAYMGYIRTNAETAVRDLLKRVAASGRTTLTASDCMDDGTPITLTITIDGPTGSAVFDFTGTGPQVYANTNAPRAITYSAVIYCLRSLVSSDIPLNQGALNPVEIIIPPNTLLSPAEGAAVVGGNVLTSQRVVDVVLKAFNACAASQGCCNNFTFGKGGEGGFGYYETIAGGSGAGPTWHGRSGVHTHITNTRITDPEIFERRYPVLLREFGLRPNSGGEGLYRGGDGCVREVEFREEVEVSMLSERRVFAPYGMEGGGEGRRGVNTLLRKDGRTVNFGGKNATRVTKGDRVRIETPGGGGWGRKGEDVKA